NEGGLTITKEVGSTGNINDIYSKGDYDRILDIHNNVLNPEHGITNSDVKERVINQLGYEVKSLVSFWTDDTGEEYRQLSFIENGQLMITDSGQPAQHIFQGYERSEEISFIINGVTLYLNHAGANIDINFEDPSNGKVQPGVLLDTPNRS